ncbi:uncharacterized protein LOC132034705 [Lycium ferocissimum]|uniref:uncharacterized protein LOC132034705 n=1 Tax=Lycium ferocissimum TaxID=112874 RepID=UPI002815588B|nr:uncharacterized protein LOC132034705 [Lycium ferocissimum]
MGMAITAYKIKHAGDRYAASLIISGFTGMLKNWWDNYLSEDNRAQILGAITIGSVMKMEGNNQVVIEEAMEDASATLIYSIAKHFIGEPKLFQDRSLELLNNLKCPKLDDFRWYKDMFLEKVMIREEFVVMIYEKERFISGLPSLFAEKVRTKIKDRFNGRIPYENLTYGDIISYINVTGLDLCTDLKLKHFLKKDQQQSRKDLGSFCQDFGFEKISAPSKKSSKIVKKSTTSKPHYRKKKNIRRAIKKRIMEGLIPTKYLEKSTSKLYSATGEKLKIDYKLSKAHICNDGIRFINNFVVTQDINEQVILETPFITQIKPYYAGLDAIYTTILGKEIRFRYLSTISQDESDFVKSKTIFKICLLSNQISYLKDEIKIKKIEQTLKTPVIERKIASFQEKLEHEVCSELPNAFWERKRHIVELPYIDGFNEQAIPTKARPI